MYKAFLGPLLTCASPRWFPFLSVTNITKLERLPEWLVTPSPSAYRLSLSHFSSLRLFHLPYESPWPISLRHLMSRLFVSQPPFPFQVWPDMKWNQDSADLPGELLHPLTRSCFLLPLLGRLPCLLSLGICLPSLWSPPFPLHALNLIPSLSPRCGSCSASLYPTLRPGALDRRLCSISFWQGRLWHTCQLLSLWHWGHSFFSAGPVCSCFSYEAYAILHALCWSRQHQQVCHFSSLFILSDSCSLLFSTFPFTSIFLEDLEGTFFSPRVLSGYNGSPDTRFSQGTTRLMSWPDEKRYLRSLQSLVVSLLLSLVSTLLFSRTGGVRSHLNFLTHRFPQFPWRNLCSLVMLIVFSLVCASTDTAYC